MKNSIILSLLGVGLMFVAGGAQAQALLEHAFHSNAVNHCQAFTPGVSNTVRNRVVGVENVGSAPVPVACAFQSEESLIYTLPTELTIHMSNTSAVPVSISCTMLVGYFGEPSQYAVTKTASVPAGSLRGSFVQFTAADNPAPLALTLGDQLIGVNCTLPPGGGLNETELEWNEIL